MYKTDSKSLEKISFDLDEKDFAGFGRVIRYLRSNDLLTIPDSKIQEALRGMKEIGRLKLDGKVYGFHVDDSMAERESNHGNGVELYLRRGGTLEDFFVPGSRDYVFDEEEAIEFLKKQKISTIYTGEIPVRGFLGIHRLSDRKDPIEHSALRDDEVSVFESSGITVIKFDILI